VSKDTFGGPFCHMQAGVITPEVGGADMHRGGVGECSEALEVYQLWGRDLPWGGHCNGWLALLPLKTVCLGTHLVGPSVTCRPV
jgi:hypothetical protein